MLEKNKLYMPSNVKARSEFFSGFGFHELIVAIVIVLITGAIAFCAYLVHQNLSGLILSLLILCAISVTILIKDNTNQSVVDYAKNMIRFSNTQKVYEYKYGREIF